MAANYQELAPLMAENEAISRYVMEKNDPGLRTLLPEICSEAEAMRIADNLRPMSPPERLQLAALLRDRERLDAAKAVLAKVPPERRSAVAKRALALHLQRRAGQQPVSTPREAPAWFAIVPLDRGSVTAGASDSVRDVATIEAQFSGDLIYAIGLLFVTASAAETSVALQVPRLISHPQKLDPPTVVALAGTAMKVSLQQIRTLARYRLAVDAAAEVATLCDKIRESYEHRNELAHFVVAPGQTSDKAVLRTLRLKADGSLTPAKPYTADQIREFASTLHARVRELDDLLTAAGLARWKDVVASLMPPQP